MLLLLSKASQIRTSQATARLGTKACLHHLPHPAELLLLCTGGLSVQPLALETAASAHTPCKSPSSSDR